jgi:hypothetical protein
MWIQDTNNPQAGVWFNSDLVFQLLVGSGGPEATPWTIVFMTGSGGGYTWSTTYATEAEAVSAIASITAEFNGSSS